jgi:hypothetical protein
VCEVSRARAGLAAAEFALLLGKMQDFTRLAAGRVRGTLLGFSPSCTIRKAADMRLKITRALSGSIDGIQLSQFVVGRIYDVGDSVGSFLLAVCAAEAEHPFGEDDRDGALIGVRRASGSSK